MSEKEIIKQIVVRLGEAVTKHCSCGVRGPEDTKACSACLIWHEMKDHLNQMVR